MFDICTLRPQVSQMSPKESPDCWVLYENKMCSALIMCCIPKPPSGAFVSGWCVHVIATCADYVKWLCFPLSAEGAHQVHASPRHLMICWAATPTCDRRGNCVCVGEFSLWEVREGYTFCWIISIWVWDLIRVLEVWALQVTGLTKFFTDEWEWLTSGGKMRWRSGRKLIFLRSLCPFYY